MGTAVRGIGEMMPELNKLIGAGDLRKAADLMKVQLGLLEQQIFDASRRLDKIEQEDAPKFLGGRGAGASLGNNPLGAGAGTMNLAHAGNLNKLARATDLQKDHRYRAGLSIKALAEIIAEADPDNAAAVKEMLNSFLRALAAHDDVVQAGRPQEAAERLAQETDRIVRERALAAAVKTSLQKGFTPQDFWRR
jgi:hypothetical protein